MSEESATPDLVELAQRIVAVTSFYAPEREDRRALDAALGILLPTHSTDDMRRRHPRPPTLASLWTSD